MIPKMLYPQKTAKGPYSLEREGAQKIEGETIPRSHPTAAKTLATSPIEGINTIWDVVEYASKTYTTRNCVGSRKLVKMHKETKMIKKVVDGKETKVPKEWMYFEKSDYSFISFTQYEELCRDLGCGLRALGMQTGNILQIFAATTPQWMAMAHAAMSQSMAIATAYDTLGPVGLTTSLTQTEARALFTDGHLFSSLINPLKEAQECRIVIWNDQDGATVNEEDVTKLKEAHPDVRILGFSELKQLGKDNRVDPVPPKREDLACIMYTSGSSGTPKGVLLTHHNVASSLGGVHPIFKEIIGGEDTLLAYLPLAHIMEFTFENAIMFWGGTLGYGAVKTLTDASMRNCAGDIKTLAPTVLIGVPNVWEAVKKGIETKLKQAPAFSQKLFWGAMAAKSFLMSTGIPGTGILDAIVFNKIKQGTGGNLKLCLSAGGAVSRETQHFISMAVAPMIIGYGLTETCAMGAIHSPYQWSLDTIGAPEASIEIKLVDFADAGYFAKNTPPQGEIWIRGGSVASQYFKNEKETSEAYTEDGWFKTGDIGEWTHDGHLKIIDRKKNLVKTLNGEYIALEKLESVYRSCDVVNNVCVFADPQKIKPIAIIYPMENTLKKLASSHGINGELEDLAKNEKVQTLVLKDMQNVGRKGGLSGIEIIEGVVISDEEWTPQSGLVTAAMKLNRKTLKEKYSTEVEAAYKRAGN